MAVVVVTGCSSGFGYHAALAFARRGDRVYAAMRDPAKGDLAKVLSNEDVDAEVIALDVNDDASVRAALATIVERERRVDALVNNAGIGGTAGPIEELSDAAWMQVIDTNVMGPIRCTRAVLPTMRAQGSGTIVNVSSISGRSYGSPILAAYSASKHALCSLSDSMLGEVASFGIRIACIEPGMFATSVLDNSPIPDPAGSPYETLSRAVATYVQTSMDNAPPPDLVVDALLAAVDGTLPPDTIHHLIGDQARMTVAAMSQMTYMEYLSRRMRATS